MDALKVDGRSQGAWSPIGFRSLLALLLWMCGSGISMQAGTPIRVLVYNYASVPGRVVDDAERNAARLLGANRSQLDWVNCAPVSSDEVCGRVWSKQSPGLRFIRGFNERQVREFGHADVPVLATIYYERVARRVHDEGADSKIGQVLGALMAHELGHLLLGERGHSTTGVMEPEWGKSQLHAAIAGALFFTGEEYRKLQERFGDQTVSGPRADNKRLSFEMMEGFLVIVRVRIGSLHDLKFILDTGATHSILDQSVADELGLGRRAGNVVSFEGLLPMDEATIGNFQVGPLHLDDLPIRVTKLSRYSSFANDVDGVLGMDVLASAKNFTIDYENRALTLEPAENSGVGKSTGCFTVPIGVAGVPLRLVVDTGFQGILLYRDHLLKLIPGMHIGPSTDIVMGRLHLERVALPEVQIAGSTETASVYFMKAPAVASDIDGYLGPTSLHARRIEFDLDRHRLRFE